jgi:hypothetical protein
MPDSRGLVDCRRTDCSTIHWSQIVQLFIIATDHRLQHTTAPKVGGGWIQRTGGRRFRRCITHFLVSLGVKAICEEAHAGQDEVAPTICSTLAKQHNVPWICLGDTSAPVPDFRFIDWSVSPPEPIVGPCPRDVHGPREDYMYSIIRQTLKESEIVLAVVGFMHAGVLARRFETEQIPVELFQMTKGLVLDESQT